MGSIAGLLVTGSDQVARDVHVKWTGNTALERDASTDGCCCAVPESSLTEFSSFTVFGASVMRVIFLIWLICPVHDICAQRCRSCSNFEYVY